MTFERIPIDASYLDCKEDFFKYCKRTASESDYESAVIHVSTTLYYHFDMEIEENGMNRVITILFAFLYEMEHSEIDPDLAYAVEWHIQDFEDGDYESLFTKEDLKLLKEDINTIKVFLKEYYKTHERKHLDP